MGHHMRQFLCAAEDAGAIRALSPDEKTRAAVLLHVMEESVHDIVGDRFDVAAKELSILVGPLRRTRANAA